ncbi:hypothetical protein D3C81_1272610 [compost metagenome]
MFGAVKLAKVCLQSAFGIQAVPVCLTQGTEGGVEGIRVEGRFAVKQGCGSGRASLFGGFQRFEGVLAFSVSRAVAVIGLQALKRLALAFERRVAHRQWNPGGQAAEQRCFVGLDIAGGVERFWRRRHDDRTAALMINQVDMYQ